MLILTKDFANGSLPSNIPLFSLGKGPVDWAEIIAGWEGSTCLCNAEIYERVFSKDNFKVVFQS
jgi:hypothetical protein